MRNLFLLCLVGLLTIAGPADGRPASRPIPDASQSEVPQMTPYQPELFVNTFTARNEKVSWWRFFAGASPGGSRDFPQAVIDSLNDDLNRVLSNPNLRARLMGATDLERYDPNLGNRKVSQMHNVSLGLARANWLNAKTDYRSEVIPTVITNHRRGVYLVVTELMTQPLTNQVVPTPVRYETIYAWETPIVFGDMLRLGPSVGVTYVHTTGLDFTAPMSGVWIAKRRWTIYASYGRSFADHDDRIFTAGLQRFMTRQLSLELGWVDARTLVPYTDQYDQRAIGGTAGLGLNAGGRRWNINGRFGLGRFNVVDPSQLADRGKFGTVVSAAGGFTF